MTAFVIPVKRLFLAKGRLARTCTPLQRRQLCLEMLRHMLAVTRTCPHVDLAAVVSPDEQLETLLRREFPEVRFLREEGDLNEAAGIAARTLAADGFDAMLFALGDLPLLTAEEVEEALEAGRDAPLVLLPDRHGRGTNAMLLSPPDLLPRFSFGENSLAAHLGAAEDLGLRAALLRLPGFGWDVDTPEDLAPIRREVLPPPGA